MEKIIPILIIAIIIILIAVLTFSALKKQMAERREAEQEVKAFCLEIENAVRIKIWTEAEYAREFSSGRFPSRNLKYLTHYVLAEMPSGENIKRSFLFGGESLLRLFKKVSGFKGEISFEKDIINLYS
jgi:prophage DNA circulation protein